MTRQNIFSQVQTLIWYIFENEHLHISEKTTAKDIREWDSLNHIELIGAIEDHFDVEFDLEEMLALEKVGDIVTQIEKAKTA